jgi:hypothetical protein
MKTGTILRHEKGASGLALALLLIGNNCQEDIRHGRLTSWDRTTEWFGDCSKFIALPDLAFSSASIIGGDPRCDSSLQRAR